MNVDKFQLIDVFDSRRHKPHVIPINEQKKAIWDIEEARGMVKVRGSQSGKIFLIRDIKSRNQDKIITIIEVIDQYIRLLKERIAWTMNNGHIDYSCECGCFLFIITPHTIQEIPRNGTFEGLNKPKNIVKLETSDGLTFKEDTLIRAGRRHILLTLWKNQTIRRFPEVKRLLLHEIAHTMCNHVTYREEGNHLEDFKCNERFLKRFTETDPVIINYEGEIKHLF